MQSPEWCTGGQIYAIVDKDSDGKPEYSFVIFSLDGSDYQWPMGLAWKNGSLYVATVSSILRLDEINKHALNKKPYDADPVVVFDGLPDEKWHGAKYLGLSPDGRQLYMNIGMPCNICQPWKYQKKGTSPAFTYGSIYRMSLDGIKVELYASGVRNSVGFDWHPATQEFYFSDNGRDDMSDNTPDDEINHAPNKGQFFGFPYCHTTGSGGPEESPILRRPGVGPPLIDPDENADEIAYKCSSSKFTPAIQALGPHVAALGMRFYRHSLDGMFPKAYNHNIFIAQRGSYNRRQRIGYRVMRVVLNKAGTRVEKYEEFITGWLTGDGGVIGRPVDILQLKDGSLLVSDDMAGAVYRVTYKK